MQIMQTTEYPSCLLCCAIEDRATHILIDRISFYAIKDIDSPYTRIDEFKNKFSKKWIYQFTLNLLIIPNADYLMIYSSRIVQRYKLEDDWEEKFPFWMEDLEEEAKDILQTFFETQRFLRHKSINWKEVEEVVEFQSKQLEIR